MEVMSGVEEVPAAGGWMCRFWIPIDQPWRVEKVYAMEAMVDDASLRIERASGGLEVCERSDVRRYGDGSDGFAGRCAPWACASVASRC